jgi:N-acyl-D-aspartate/D-glutamate deacylase
MRSLTFPGAVVASDAMPVTWTAPPDDPQVWPLPPGAITHPRTAGTFSRALRLLTREGTGAFSGEGLPPRGGQLSLGRALAKCSLEPARLLQDRVPALRGKGRLQPGGDADIVVFDPDAVTDRASYRHSTRPRTGSGMSWSTASSWCGMATSWPTRGPAARSGPNRAETGRAGPAVQAPPAGFERS